MCDDRVPSYCKALFPLYEIKGHDFAGSRIFWDHHLYVEATLLERLNVKSSDSNLGGRVKRISSSRKQMRAGDELTIEAVGFIRDYNRGIVRPLCRYSPCSAMVSRSGNADGIFLRLFARSKSSNALGVATVTTAVVRIGNTLATSR